MAAVGRRLFDWGPGIPLGVDVGARVEIDTVTVGVREVMGVAKDVVVGVESVEEVEEVGERVVEVGWVEVIEEVTGGLVVTGAVEEVAVMDGVAEGPGDESPP